MQYMSANNNNNNNTVNYTVDFNLQKTICIRYVWGKSLSGTLYSHYVIYSEIIYGNSNAVI